MNYATNEPPSLASMPESGEGYRAFLQGCTRSANWHKIGTLAYVAWQLGWDMAQDDSKQEGFV